MAYSFLNGKSNYDEPEDFKKTNFSVDTITKIVLKEQQLVLNKNIDNKSFRCILKFGSLKRPIKKKGVLMANTVKHLWA